MLLVKTCTDNNMIVILYSTIFAVVESCKTNLVSTFLFIFIDLQSINIALIITTDNSQ